VTRAPIRKRKAKPGRPWRAGVASAVLTITAVAVVVVLFSLWSFFAPGPASRDGQPTTVQLRKGAHMAEIGADLQRAGVIRSAAIFMAAAQVSGEGRKLRAGEYAFPSRASLARVLQRMKLGLIVHHRITIPEGTPSKQVAEILNRADVLVGSAPTPPEGAILPETYDVVRGEERSAVLQRMMDADDRVLARLWAKRRPGLPYTDVEQAVVLASIVEKETALGAERPRVAAVYLNRLKQGVRLDSDPSVIYGITKGDPLGHGLRESELKADTPYNTYLNAGLPPTPIDNPGQAALAAVMDPPATDEVYFVANGTGGHAFAKSLAEHELNVQRWRKIEQQRTQGMAIQSAAEALPQGPALAGAPAGVPVPLEHR
jgi:UPF0755 protein